MSLKTFNNIFKKFVLLLFVFFVLAACENRPEGVLNKEEMADFLTDLHKLEGSLNANLQTNVNNQQDIYYYNALFKKHGITQAIFDSSLVFYTENPEKFEDIYLNVIKQLTEHDSIVKKRFYHPIDSAALRKMKTDLWAKATKYEIKQDTARTQLRFEITNPDLLTQDKYTLSLLQRISPTNTKLKQAIVMRIKYKNGKVDSVYTKVYKDSILRRYSLHLTARRKLRIEKISGSLLIGKSTTTKTNIYIDSVKLIREFDSLAKDSIDKVLKRIENPIKHVDSLHIKNKFRLRNIVIQNKKNEPHK